MAEGLGCDSVVSQDGHVVLSRQLTQQVHQLLLQACFLFGQEVKGDEDTYKYLQLISHTLTQLGLILKCHIIVVYQERQY